MAHHRLLAGLIVALLLRPATARAEEDDDRFHFGITAMGEWYPKLGDQQSVLTGLRIHIGLYESIYAVVEAGYSAAGNTPGDGDDGVMAGAGIEASTAIVEQILDLVVRVTVDFRVAQTTDLPTGDLSLIAAQLASGVRLFDVLELHVMGGFGFHGSFGIGLGAAVGFFL